METCESYHLPEQKGIRVIFSQDPCPFSHVMGVGWLELVGWLVGWDLFLYHFDTHHEGSMKEGPKWDVPPMHLQTGPS